MTNRDRCVAAVEIALVASDEAGVDGTDRCANDPVGFDPAFVQGLIDACLIGIERTASLQHQNELAKLGEVSPPAAAIPG